MYEMRFEPAIFELKKNNEKFNKFLFLLARVWNGDVPLKISSNYVDMASKIPLHVEMFFAPHLSQDL